jgi:hypothetical protein
MLYNRNMSTSNQHKEELMSNLPTPSPDEQDEINASNGMAVAPFSPAEETTAQRLTRELKEKHFPTLVGKTAADDRKRLSVQIDEGVINPIMLARLLGIVPQQVYQAIAKGKLPAMTDNDTQKRRIKFDDAVRWAANYLDRKDLRERQKEQEAQVAAEG